MNGKINKHGNLSMERKGKMKPVDCPWTVDGMDKNGVEQQRYCGDWCALFGEPELYPPVLPEEKTTVALEICNKSLFFETFTDERNKE